MRDAYSNEYLRATAGDVTNALDRGLATGRLIEEAERLIRTIETSHKKAVRELPIAPLLAAVERAKGLG